MSISNIGGPNAVISGSFGSRFNIAASGIQDGLTRLNVASNNIANSNTDGFIPASVISSALPTGGVESQVVPGVPPSPSSYSNAGNSTGGNATFPSQTDLGNEIVNVIVAKSTVAANAKVLRTSKDTTKAIIDAIG
jgi:flagellar hook protein FlgE